MPTEPLLQTILKAIPDLLPGNPAVVKAIQVSAARHHGVYRITTDTGLTLAVKHHPFASLTQNHPYNLLDVEQTTARLLRADGCPVPECYAIDSQNFLTVSEWCGDLTLDDYCQETSGNPAETIVSRVLDGIVAIQSSFQNNIEKLSPMAFPGCDVEGLMQSWRETTDQVAQSLPGIIGYLNPEIRIANTQIENCWSELIKTLSQNSPLLGPTDYNARNIVVDTEKQAVSILEFSKLGWDWPERRLVQYVSSLGAGRRNARFHTLISPESVSLYANHRFKISSGPEFRKTMLDGHHFIFYLLAGIRILKALSSPDTESNAALLSVWNNPEERLKQLGQILSVPLSEYPAANQLRSYFRS